MRRTLSSLVLLAALTTVAAQQPPGGYELSPVAVPPAMKAALLKRVNIDKAEGTAEEMLTKIAEDNKVKVEISPLLRKQSARELGTRGMVLNQKNMRLDILMHNLLTNAGIPPVCVVKEDILVFTTESDPAALLKKTPAVPGAMVVSAVRQLPDATHAFIVSAIRKKLTEKSDADTMNNVPLSDVLAGVTKKTGMPFPIHARSFEVAGIADAAGQKVTVKGGKSVTYESVLREALKAANGELVIDGYGNHEIVHKDDRRARPKK